MTSKRSLILDLDFTLLHLEWRPDSIEVPGRTRSAWIAPPTVALLHALQTDFDIVLATARSWDGARWVYDGLAARDVKVSALVVEDGALLGQPETLQALDENFKTETLRDFVESQKTATWPIFEWQRDFQACLVARCEDQENAAILHHIFAEQLEWRTSSTRFFRDGRKVYIIAREADKWSALQRLLGENAALSAGVGDGENDVTWLKNVRAPCTLQGAAPSILALVKMRNGYISELSGHDGICDVLRHLIDAL